MGIGGIGGITSAVSMPATQITASDLKDQKSKNLQNEITDVQRQMQKLSSEEELSVTEKAVEKEKLQKEKSSLDTKLKLHQDELLKSQKREIKSAELQEDRKPAATKGSEDKPADDPSGEKKLPADDRRALQPGTVIAQNSDGTVILKEVLSQAANRDADTESKQSDEAKEEVVAERETKSADAETVTGANLSEKEVRTIISADASMQQASRQEALVAKTNNDIAVLQGEIRQDAYRGVDTEKKEAELKDLQEQRKREMAVQFSLMGEINNATPSEMETNERTFYVSGVNASQEDQALQQGFQVSIV